MMVESQRNVTKNIDAFSNDLAASAEELFSSAEEVNASTEEIAGNTQEVAKSADAQETLVVDVSEALVQLSSLIQLAKNKASEANKTSQNSMDTAIFGRDKVENTVKAMEDISSSTKETSKLLSVLEELSNKVEGIITVINSISQQTTLLALNAAIEAARAGEHGKGFTVVADEVRKLSEQTNEGANEISLLINQMSDLIKKAVQSMTYGNEAVNKGVQVVNETDKSFINIIEGVIQITNDIGQVLDITQDEVANSDQIVALIDSIATGADICSESSKQISESAGTGCSYGEHDSRGTGGK